MARWSMASYNRFLGASMSRYGHSRKTAAQHYREMRGRLDRPVTRADIRNHPHIAKQAATRAFGVKPPVAVPVKPSARRAPEEIIRERERIIEEEMLEEFEDDEELNFSEIY